MGDGQRSMTKAIPPVELHDVIETEVGNEVEHVVRDHDCRGRSPASPRVFYDRSQRWTVQVIEMGVRNHDQIDWRQIANPQTWLAQSFQHEQPAREIGIKYDILPADLHEKAGMPNEGHAQFPIRDQLRFVNSSRAGGDSGMAH